MDSLTQFVLGAAVAEATIGRRVGRLGALTGGILATLPDLDVFVSLGDPVSDFTYHRSATHSLLVLTLVAPLLAWVVSRLKAEWRDLYGPWCLTTWLVLVTHPLLDAQTVYGTQLLWPLTEFPFGTGSMFIIDPLYTLPLFAAVVAAQFMHHASGKPARINRIALAISSVYLAVAFGIQQHVRAQVMPQIEAAGIRTERVGVWNTPFNVLAWRVVAVEPARYHVGYYSLLGSGQVSFEHWPSTPSLLEPVRDAWPVARLQWFTKGFNAVERHGERIVIRDLRMGLEPDHFVFSFAVAEQRDGTVRAVAPVRVAPAPYTAEDWQGVWQAVRGER